MSDIFKIWEPYREDKFGIIEIAQALIEKVKKDQEVIKRRGSDINKSELQDRAVQILIKKYGKENVTVNSNGVFVNGNAVDPVSVVRGPYEGTKSTSTGKQSYVGPKGSSSGSVYSDRASESEVSAQAQAGTDAKNYPPTKMDGVGWNDSGYFIFIIYHGERGSGPMGFWPSIPDSHRKYTLSINGRPYLDLPGPGGEFNHDCYLFTTKNIQWETFFRSRAYYELSNANFADTDDSYLIQRIAYLSQNYNSVSASSEEDRVDTVWADGANGFDAGTDDQCGYFGPVVGVGWGHAYFCKVASTAGYPYKEYEICDPKTKQCYRVGGFLDANGQITSTFPSSYVSKNISVMASQTRVTLSDVIYGSNLPQQETAISAAQIAESSNFAYRPPIKEETLEPPPNESAVLESQKTTWSFVAAEGLSVNWESLNEIEFYTASGPEERDGVDVTLDNDYFTVVWGSLDSRVMYTTAFGSRGENPVRFAIDFKDRGIKFCRNIMSGSRYTKNGYKNIMENADSIFYSNDPVYLDIKEWITSERDFEDSSIGEGGSTGESLVYNPNPVDGYPAPPTEE